LSAREQQTTNLYLDERIYNKGDWFGPEIQGLRAHRDTVLVFADDHPLRKFGHRCRYFLFDPQSGEFYEQLNALLPPYLQRKPATYKVFHNPVPSTPRPGIYRVRTPVPVPVPTPSSGRRYAILYSSSLDLNDMNTLEFCYRTLVDRYAFAPGDIQVLNGDRTLGEDKGSPPPKYSGDGTDFRMVLTGKGDKADLEAALGSVRGSIQAQDLLFIFTAGHGYIVSDSKGVDESALISYPSAAYPASNFAQQLSLFPAYRGLIVTMAQCYSGGFNGLVIGANNSTQTPTTIASSVDAEGEAAHNTHWDIFGCNWIAAQRGNTATGSPVNADTGPVDGVIEADEAFKYTLLVNTQDDPQRQDSSDAAGLLTLGAMTTPMPPTMHVFLRRAMEKFGLMHGTPEELEAFRLRALPELQRFLLPKLEGNAEILDKQLTPEVDAIIERVLKTEPAGHTKKPVPRQARTHAGHPHR
jgi:hypothetical protein